MLRGGWPTPRSRRSDLLHRTWVEGEGGLRGRRVDRAAPGQGQRVSAAVGTCLDAVVLVHVRHGEGEQQPGGERRRHLRRQRLDLDRGQPRCRAASSLQARHVEMIVQALAERLGDDREVGMPPRHLQQVAAAQPLQPQRGPLARAAAASAAPGRRSGGSAGRTGRCRPARRGSGRSTFSGVRPVEQVEDRLVGVGQADQDAVVVVQALRAIAEPLAAAGFERQPQRQVQPAAERAEQDHLPVAELIARRLDHERPVGRQAAGAQLVAGERGRAGCGPRRRRGSTRAAASRGSPAASSRVGQFAQEVADGQAEVVAAAGRSRRARTAPSPAPLGRRDDDAVGLDALEPPGIGAEQERRRRRGARR